MAFQKFNDYIINTILKSDNSIPKEKNNYANQNIIFQQKFGKAKVKALRLRAQVVEVCLV